MKTRKPIKGITMIEIGLAGVLLVVLALLVYWYSDGLASYSPNALTYQIIGKENFQFSNDAKFRDKKNGIVAIDKDGERSIADTPILMKDSTDIILSKNMLLMVPNESLSVSRINRFTKISNHSGIIIYEADNKHAETYGGFLYDGEDIFVFLDNTKLYIGSEIIELPPLSYARVIYDKEVEYYNSETKESKTVSTINIKTSALSERGYKLDLCNDVIYVNEEESLLYPVVDEIKTIEME